MTRYANAAGRLLLGALVLATAGCPADANDMACAFNLDEMRCGFSDSYEEGEFGEGWDVSTVTSLQGCIDVCDAAGLLRTVQTAVIIDEDAYTVSDAQVQTRIDAAAEILFKLTGTTMALHGIERVTALGDSDWDPMADYLAAHPDDPPQFIVLAAPRTAAVVTGGYAAFTPPLSGYCNDFAYPGGHDRVYASVIDWTHRFAACGYDIDHYEATLEWVKVSNASLDDGTCKGVPGVPCVFDDALGYDRCGNIPGDLPYLASADAFSSATLVHEIMHTFGFFGGPDHFGTATCNSEMNGAPYGQGDLATFQEYTGMCPYVFDNLVEGYAPCDSLEPPVGNCHEVAALPTTLDAPPPNAATVRLLGSTETWPLTDVLLAGESDPWSYRLRYASPSDATRWIDVSLSQPLEEGACRWAWSPDDPEGGSPHLNLYVGGANFRFTGSYCALTITDGWLGPGDGDFAAHTNTCRLHVAAGVEAATTLTVSFHSDMQFTGINGQDVIR